MLAKQYALRVFPAETRLTVYRRLQVDRFFDRTAKLCIYFWFTYFCHILGYVAELSSWGFLISITLKAKKRTGEIAKMRCQKVTFLWPKQNLPRTYRAGTQRPWEATRVTFSLQRPAETSQSVAKCPADARTVSHNGRSYVLKVVFLQTFTKLTSEATIVKLTL